MAEQIQTRSVEEIQKDIDLRRKELNALNAELRLVEKVKALYAAPATPAPAKAKA